MIFYSFRLHQRPTSRRKETANLYGLLIASTVAVERSRYTKYKMIKKKKGEGERCLCDTSARQGRLFRKPWSIYSQPRRKKFAETWLEQSFDCWMQQGYETIAMQSPSTMKNQNKEEHEQSRQRNHRRHAAFMRHMAVDE